MSKPDWQSQSYAKGGGSSAPSNLNSKLSAGAPSLHSKIARPTQQMGGLVTGAPAVRKFADGGSVDDATYSSPEYQSDKASGLEASKGESVGFFDRLRMGNIDDPSSEAYKRLGAGRGMAERMKSMPDESEAETKRLAATAPSAPASEDQSAAETARLQRQNDAAPAAAPAAKQSFKDAFKAASDGSTFEWGGKQYKKEYASNKASPSKPAAKADSAPDTGDETARLAKLHPANKAKGTALSSMVNLDDVDPKTLLPKKK